MYVASRNCTACNWSLCHRYSWKLSMSLEYQATVAVSSNLPRYVSCGQFFNRPPRGVIYDYILIIDY